MSDLLTMYAAQANSPSTTTLGEISATATSVTVSDVSVLPSATPYLLTLGFDKSASETVLVTAVSGNTLTIVRGVDGNALLWVAGTKIARIFTAKDLNDIQANIRTLNEDKQDAMTVDASPTPDSQNPVSSGGVYSDLQNKAGQTAFNNHAGNSGIHVSTTEKTTWNNKQDAILGTNGQIVGIGPDGKPRAIAAPESATTFELSLSVAGWSNNRQTVANSNIEASGYVYIVSPVSGSYISYCNSSIRAENVTTAGAMTFVCEDVPTSALTVTVVKMEVE